VCNNLCHFCQGGHCTEVPNCAIIVKACALMLMHMSEKSFSSETRFVRCAPCGSPSLATLKGWKGSLPLFMLYVICIADVDDVPWNVGCDERQHVANLWASHRACPTSTCLYLHAQCTFLNLPGNLCKPDVCTKSSGSCMFLHITAMYNAMQTLTGMKSE
jgi:hypothetical protein